MEKIDTVIKVSAKVIDGVKEVTIVFLTSNGEMRPVVVTEKDGNYNEVMRVLKSSDSPEDKAKQLLILTNPEISLKHEISASQVLGDNIRLENGIVYFGEHKLESTLSSYLVELVKSENRDEKLWNSLVLFLDNLHQNTDPEVRQQLFRWMNYEMNDGVSFTITDDGCFIGYRGCVGTVLEPMSRNSGTAWVDGVKHVGQIPNPIGSTITMPRHMVQADPTVGCSHGLHVGTYGYARDWAHILIRVKVNPRDVVSVPTECDSQKIRVCRFEVLEASLEPVNSHTYSLPSVEEKLGFEMYEGDVVEVTYYSSTNSGSVTIVGEVYEVGNDYIKVYSDEAGHKTLKTSRLISANVLVGPGSEECDECDDQCSHCGLDAEEFKANDEDELIAEVSLGDTVYVEYTSKSKGRDVQLHGVIANLTPGRIVVKSVAGDYITLTADNLISIEVLPF